MKIGEYQIKPCGSGMFYFVFYVIRIGSCFVYSPVPKVPDLTGSGCKTLLIIACFQYLLSELRLLTKTRIEVYPLSSQNYAAVLRHGITASSEFK
jgi:hypothetical protein